MAKLAPSTWCCSFGVHHLDGWTNPGSVGDILLGNMVKDGENMLNIKGPISPSYGLCEMIFGLYHTLSILIQWLLVSILMFVAKQSPCSAYVWLVKSSCLIDSICWWKRSIFVSWIQISLSLSMVPLVWGPEMIVPFSKGHNSEVNWCFSPVWKHPKDLVDDSLISYPYDNPHTLPL